MGKGRTVAGVASVCAEAVLVYSRCVQYQVECVQTGGCSVANLLTLLT